MTYTEIHTLAARGDPLPPFQPMPDRACYESLCCLRRLYELAVLDEKAVRVRKQEIRRAHEEAAEAFGQYIAVARAYSGNSRAAGQAVREMVRALEGGNADYVLAGRRGDRQADERQRDAGRIAEKGGGSGGAVRRRAQRKGSGIMTISTRG